MTRMTGPYCAVMVNLVIDTHTHIHTSPGGYVGISHQSTIVDVVEVAPRVACSHPGGRKGSACSPLPFQWGTNLRVTSLALVGLIGLWLVAWTEPRLLGITTDQQARWGDRAELGTGLRLTERFRSANAQLYRLAPSIGYSGMNPVAFFCLALTFDLCQPIPALGTVALRISVATAVGAHCRHGPHGLLGLFA